MSKSMVREALVTSVAKTPPSAPPVRFHKHPGVDRPEGETGSVGDEALVEQPLHLGGREVRVEHQPGPLPDQGQVAGLVQWPAGCCGAAVLPHDGPVGDAGAPVPGHHGLPLVGDPDGPGHPAVVGQSAGHLGQRGPHQLPDLAGVVLHPARAGGSTG